MNMIVQEPQTVQVGEPYHTTQFAGSIRRHVQVYDTSTFPCCSPFTTCSAMPVIDQIEQSSNRVHSNGALHYICDGELFRLHPLFLQDPLALQIITFYGGVVV